MNEHKDITLESKDLPKMLEQLEEGFYRFDRNAILEGKNKIKLRSITPRYIESIEIWVAYK